jgi:L-alanine-DL-glutamate epimerase-like enolase superfamily enzyme
MEISEVEIHEFDFQLEDVGMHEAHQVYDPGSTLEPQGFILTVRTTDGTEGHYRGFLFTPPMISQIKMAAPEFLIGRDPREREAIWYDLWRAFRHTDHFGLGPIDIALWDLAGKQYDESVSALLGGYRDVIPAYASTHWGDSAPEGLSTPDAYAAFATECLAEGYPAFKIHPFGDPDRDIAVCRAVADAVGEDMELMLDPASEYRTYSETLRVGRALDELDFLWYEDPMSDTGESIEMASRLTNELETLVLGCEHIRGGPFARVAHLTRGALDLVRADAHLDGGITGAMKVARLAEAFGTDVEFHVGGPAHLHCLSAIQNTNYYEHGLLHPEVEWMSAQGYQGDPEQLQSDGTIPVPEGPGLGVEIDWAFVKERTTEHTVIDTPGASGLS